jgi:hypothetical protein
MAFDSIYTKYAFSSPSIIDIYAKLNVTSSILVHIIESDSGSAHCAKESICSCKYIHNGRVCAVKFVGHMNHIWSLSHIKCIILQVVLCLLFLLYVVLLCRGAHLARHVTHHVVRHGKSSCQSYCPSYHLTACCACNAWKIAGKTRHETITMPIYVHF